MYITAVKSPILWLLAQAQEGQKEAFQGGLASEWVEKPPCGAPKRRQPTDWFGRGLAMT